MNSINRHLTRLILIVSGVAVLISSSAFFLVEAYFSQHAAIEHISPLAETLGINLQSTLALKDTYRGKTILATLSADPNIQAAYLFTRDNRPLIFYKRSSQPEESIFISVPEDAFPQEKIETLLQDGQKHVITDGSYLAVISPVKKNGTKLGSICLVSHLSHIRQKLFVWAALATIISGLSLWIGLILAKRLQQTISHPVLRLAATMRQVPATRSLSLYSEPCVIKEVNTLVAGFNDMIQRINQQEQEMTDLLNSLEIRIGERTTELSRSLREKELLLREVHHRVKNNLQIIASLLTLQMKKSGDPAIADTLRASLSRIRSISSIHEKLYAGQLTQEVDLGDHLSALATEIFMLHDDCSQQIELRLSLCVAPVDLDRLINLSLILNELLSNALKHAFPAKRSGYIEVSLKSTEDCLYLAIQDNGIGLPANFCAESLKTLGLRLVNGLIREFQGEIKIQAVTIGTLVVVACPLPSRSDARETEI